MEPKTYIAAPGRSLPFNGLVSLPETRHDSGNKSVSGKVAVWTGTMDACGLPEAQNSAFPETFSSLAKPVELDSIIAEVKEKYDINF